MIMGEGAVIEQLPPLPVPPARGDDSVVAAISAAQAAALLALARTIHQFHTYPATSPLCIDAIAACRKALAALGHGNALLFNVPPDGAPNEEPATAVSGAAMIEQELGRRLRRNRVASLAIDPDASARDLSRFCSHLIRCSETGDARPPLVERLAEDGVVTVVLKIALHPEVLGVSAPTATHVQLIESEHRRREESRGPDTAVEYLYPPNKGWVRLDPAGRGQGRRRRMSSGSTESGGAPAAASSRARDCRTSFTGVGTPWSLPRSTISPLR